MRVPGGSAAVVESPGAGAVPSPVMEQTTLASGCWSKPAASCSCNRATWVFELPDHGDQGDHRSAHVHAQGGGGDKLSSHLEVSMASATVTFPSRY